MAEDKPSGSDYMLYTSPCTLNQLILYTCPFVLIATNETYVPVFQSKNYILMCTSNTIPGTGYRKKI